MGLLLIQFPATLMGDLMSHGMTLKMGVKYMEKGAALHNHIAAQGHVLVMSNGKWLCDDVEKVQSMIDEFDALNGAKMLKVAELKAYESSVRLLTSEGQAAEILINDMTHVDDVNSYDVTTAPGW